MASTLCCEVSLNTQECEFPANLDDESAEAVRSRCWSCGARACKGCSWSDDGPLHQDHVPVCASATTAQASTKRHASDVAKDLA